MTSYPGLSGEDPLEALIAECLGRIELEGDAAIEDMCRLHAGQAAAIRTRIELLRSADLLVGPRTADAAPTRLGDFRILERLGGGNMGVVYLAEQESLGRRVALKLIRPERLYFGGAKERFRREVEAVAKLQHAGIAQVFLAGEENGVPYFAMEFVEGVALSHVMEEHAGRRPADLSGSDLEATVRRLTGDAGGENAGGGGDAALFRGSWPTVCLRIALEAAEALDHAHRRGVLHRDVKPSNLMITPAGRVLLVDFGLARTEGAVEMTETGSPIGSLAYMSPEQLEGRHKDLGPGSDLYSLGVTLYELLALRRPHDASSTAETCRRISEGRPERLRHLNPAVSADAETVCLKAMDPDPARRYPSGADFARDLANVLAFRPIEARRAGALLRGRRFVQRRPGAAVALVLGFLLVVGLPTVLYLQERGARTAIEAEAEVARQTTEFMLGLFESATPGESLGEDIPVRLLLDQGARRIEDELVDQPMIRARLLRTLGRVYGSLGSYDKAEGLLQEAETILATGVDIGSGKSEDVTWFLAYAKARKGDYATAEAMYRDVLARLEESFGPRHTLLGQCLSDFGVCLHWMGRTADAEDAHRRSVALNREIHPTEHSDLARSLAGLASFLVSTGRQSEARPLLEEALAMRERLYPRGAPAIVENLTNLAWCLTDLREHEAAERHLRRAVEESRRIFAKGHPVLTLPLVAQGHFLQTAGRFAEAEVPLREALAIVESGLGANHPQVARCLNDLGSVLLRLGRHEEAHGFLVRALAIWIKVHGEEHGNVCIALMNLADAKIVLGQEEEAERLARRGVDVKRRLEPSGSASIAGGLTTLGWIQIMRRQPAAAEATYAEAISIYEQLPASAVELGRARSFLAMTHNLRSDGARGEEQARLAREVLQRSCPPGHPFLAHAAYMLGWACLSQRKPEAETFIAESIELYRRAFPAGVPEMAFPLDALGTLWARGRPAEALPLLRDALDIRRRFLRPDDHWLRVSIHNLGVVHFLLQDDAAARPLLHEAIALWRTHGPAARGNLGGSLYYAALIEERAGKLEAAAVLAEDGLQHQRAAYPAGNQATANTASLLGSIKCRLGDYEEAERLLLASWRELTTAVGRKHADAGKTAGRLVELYEKWGRPERGEEFRRAETRKQDDRQR